TAPCGSGRRGPSRRDDRRGLRQRLSAAGRGPQARVGLLVTPPPRSLQTLTGRYDREVFEPEGGGGLFFLGVVGSEAGDFSLDGGTALLVPAEGDAVPTLTADRQA